LADKWLTRHVSLISDRTDRTNNDLYRSYFLLGKTKLALGQPMLARDAFQYALTGKLNKTEYIHTTSALVEAHRRQQNLVDALDVLEDVRSWQFSLTEFTEILLLKAEVLREMGLVDKAIAVLGDRAEYLTDPQLKARTSFELAKCHIAEHNLELASRMLNKTRLLVEPGPLADHVGLELANVCLMLDQNDQAISICKQLLDSGPTQQTKQKALSLFAAAQKRKKNYESAALALLGQWDRIKSINENALSDESAIPSDYPTRHNKARQLTQ
jgi:tetratricopeptide (TPR) repeat protein